MISSPKRAFVLAAGFGTRMLPITRDLPKPLLPFWGRPVLDRVLDMLARWGVREVVINLHHKSDEMLSHILNRPRKDLEVNLSFEPDILGTGGALRKAEWFLVNGPCWLVNADIVCDVNPRPLLRAFNPGRSIAAAWLYSGRGPRTVVTKNGLVTNWRGENARTFTGLQLVSPKILNYLPASGFASLITAYEAAMKDGWTIAGVEVPGAYWADIGTPAQYLEAHREQRGGRVFASIGEGVMVARSARIRNSVIMDGARIMAGARVENAIVGRGTVVRGAVDHIAMPAARALDEVEQDAVRDFGWEPDAATALPMGPRGSARTFTRLRHGTRNVMLVHYDPSRHENTLYAGHARFLRRVGVHVPSVLLDRPDLNVTIWEDLGDRCVQDVVRGMRLSSVERLYRRILDAVLVLHTRGTRAARKERLALVPAFRPRLYRWERDLFAEHLLEGRLQMPARQITAIKRDLARVAAHLLRAPRVLVHRDLQSSNILLTRQGPAFIDFQGMRYGPAVYDLASLLCDPYVAFPSALQERLLMHYAEQCGRAAMIRETFWFAAIQRLIQALGAYARLAESPDTASFAAYIPSAVQMLRRALGYVDGLPALRAWCHTARQA